MFQSETNTKYSLSSVLWAPSFAGVVDLLLKDNTGPNAHNRFDEVAHHEPPEAKTQVFKDFSGDWCHVLIEPWGPGIALHSTKAAVQVGWETIKLHLDRLKFR